MCSPLNIGCAPTHFPLLVDSAVDKLYSDHGDILLEREAKQVLYRHGDRHRSAFDRAIRAGQLDALSDQLARRLSVALDNTTQRRGHVKKITADALKEVLKEDPWVPGRKLSSED